MFSTEFNTERCWTSKVTTTEVSPTSTIVSCVTYRSCNITIFFQVKSYLWHIIIVMNPCSDSIRKRSQRLSSLSCVMQNIRSASTASLHTRQNERCNVTSVYTVSSLSCLHEMTLINNVPFGLNCLLANNLYFSLISGWLWGVISWFNRETHALFRWDRKGWVQRNKGQIHCAFNLLPTGSIVLMTARKHQDRP